MSRRCISTPGGATLPRTHEDRAERPVRRGHTLTDTLDREWERLSLRPATVRRVRAVRTDDPALDRWAHDRLGSVRRLDDVVALTDRRRGVDADRFLHWLLLAAPHEPLAARIVLQRLLPLTLARSAQWRITDGDGTAVDQAIAAVTIEISRYDRSSFRRHIAPRLVGAAVHDAFRKPRRRRAAVVEVSSAHDRFEYRAAPDRHLHPLVAVRRLLLAGADAGLDDDLLELARRWARGESTAQIAAASGCTDRTVRNRRRRLIDRLREELDDTWADWVDPLTGVEAGRVRSAA